jgi:myo-inositol-1(or 4)-monophosphatase
VDDLQIVTRLAEKVRAVVEATIAEKGDYERIVRQRPRDVTRKIDLTAERALDDAIGDLGIAAKVISEEIGERIVPPGGKSEYALLFDPVDGSNNVVTGLPYYCTSLALSRKVSGTKFADVEAAAVASACCGLYAAARGRGAFRDGEPIVRKRREGKPVYAGLTTYWSDWDHRSLSPSELDADVSSAKAGGAAGYVLFRYNDGTSYIPPLT